MILIIMIMLMLGHLEVQSGAPGGSEWGTWRLRVGHLQVQSGALAGSEWGTCRLRVGHLEAQSGALAGSYVNLTSFS